MKPMTPHHTRTAIAVLALALTCTHVAHAQSAAPITGHANVLDGDSLIVGKHEIRLFGIDALEWDQHCERDGERWPCGKAATRALGKLVAERTVTCVKRKRDLDRYGRIVATCHAVGKDLAAAMVTEGLALADRRFSTAYLEHERIAQTARRGLHQGGSVAPWDHRRSKRSTSTRVASPTTEHNTECRIKGNISRRNGDRIYHVPSGAYYSRTRIDESQGERWFCSEAEAPPSGMETVEAVSNRIPTDATGDHDMSESKTSHLPDPTDTEP